MKKLRIDYLYNKYVMQKIYVQFFGLMSRMFANGPGDRGSIPGRVIRKTPKMALDATLLNIQQYKVRVKWIKSGNRVVPTKEANTSSIVFYKLINVYSFITIGNNLKKLGFHIDQTKA